MVQRRRPGYLRRPLNTYTRRLLDALLDLYQLLRTPRPLDDLLQSILDTALGCVPGAQRGSLLVADGDQLVYRAVNGYDLAQLRRVHFPANLIRDQVLHGGRTVQVQDYTTWDDQYVGSEAYTILLEHGAISEIRRSLVTAILVGGRFYGTLVLDNLHSHAPFPPAAETIARLFAEQAGALIEQAILIEQLRQTNTMLIEAEKLASLGRFIANIAHEINNPLTAVLGYADFLALSNLDPTAHTLLLQLRAGADRVREIVRNLQLFARQQRGGQTHVNLNLLIEQTLTLKRGDLGLDQIDVRLDLDELPPTWGDAGQLSQVLLNLLVNAQLALREREAPRQISLRTWAEADLAGDQWLMLRVSDNGPGVPAEIAVQIFEPFFTTRPAGKGTGLGLSICQTIVSAHGGEIRLEPVAEGASFLVTLPVRLPQIDAPAPPPPQRRAAPPQGQRILLVDDDLAVVSVVRAALEPGNSLAIAGNGIEGLRILERETFDLILCDLRMPEMDGLEFYRRLCASRPELANCVLFISGDTSSPTTGTFFAESRRPLLTKPFTPEELFAAIGTNE